MRHSREKGMPHIILHLEGILCSSSSCSCTIVHLLEGEVCYLQEAHVVLGDYRPHVFHTYMSSSVLINYIFFIYYIYNHYYTPPIV